MLVAIIDQPAPADNANRDDRIVFLGADRDGTVLEVMAVETEAGLLGDPRGADPSQVP